MEEHEKVLLARQVLADLLLDAEKRGSCAAQCAGLALAAHGRGCGGRLADALCRGAGPVVWPRRVAGARRAACEQALGLPADADMAQVVAMCADDAFDVRSVRWLLDVVKQWTDKKAT
jgi:ATP-dependent helicase/nuclease subunit A